MSDLTLAQALRLQRWLTELLNRLAWEYDPDDGEELVA
jgi:hypothetical protein